MTSFADEACEAFDSSPSGPSELPRTVLFYTESQERPSGIGNNLASLDSASDPIVVHDQHSFSSFADTEVATETSETLIDDSPIQKHEGEAVGSSSIHETRPPVCEDFERFAQSSSPASDFHLDNNAPTESSFGVQNCSSLKDQAGSKQSTEKCDISQVEEPREIHTVPGTVAITSNPRAKRKEGGISSEPRRSERLAKRARTGRQTTRKSHQFPRNSTES